MRFCDNSGHSMLVLTKLLLSRKLCFGVHVWHGVEWSGVGWANNVHSPALICMIYASSNPLLTCYWAFQHDLDATLLTCSWNFNLAMLRS